MSKTIKIIDTFPSFLTWWQNVQDIPLDEKIDSWASEYMSSWPDLPTLQVEDYTSQQLNWKQVAHEMVFPHLDARLESMSQAHKNLLTLCERIYGTAQQNLNFNSQVTFVIYVGIGCGAGWVTPYQHSPAILFGLENIAECGWSSSETIAGLLAHEIGHLAHHHWRSQHSKPSTSGPWWQLYEEGFAQVCESLILGTPSWHQASQDNTWLSWCQSKKGWLATEFLKTVDDGQAVSPFFGSWYDIGGKKQTGYFLGCAVIEELLQSFELQEIALFEDNDIKDHVRPILEKVGRNSS